jgi:hypothetical protein
MKHALRKTSERATQIEKAIALAGFGPLVYGILSHPRMIPKSGAFVPDVGWLPGFRQPSRMIELCLVVVTELCRTMD